MSALPMWTLLAASLVLGLAALARMAGSAPDTPADVAGVIHLPEPVAGGIATVFALAALVFLAGLVRRLRARAADEVGTPGPERPRPPAWLRVLNQIMSIAYLLVFVYLVWRGAIPIVDMLARGLGVAAGGGPAAGGQTPVGAPPLVTWAYAALAGVAGLAALAFALWIGFADRIAEWWEGRADGPHFPPLAGVLEESADDLRADPDARRAIIHCYARFERVAARSGLERKAWLTPMEFMREAIARRPVPGNALPTLTGLFELARFSHRALGPLERDRALDALDAIKATLAEEGTDALPS